MWPFSVTPAYLGVAVLSDPCLPWSGRSDSPRAACCTASVCGKVAVKHAAPGLVAGPEMLVQTANMELTTRREYSIRASIITF